MSEIAASRYEIIKKLGAGGGGSVFLAEDMRLAKQVVLKIDKRKITTRTELLRREVDILKDLKHPNIPAVYDFFAENEKVVTVMEYIEGESLDKPLKRGEKFPQAQVLEWGKELLEALCYLHKPVHGTPPRGFVHSDIKPANLMRRTDNTVCLIDFNIALALGETNIIGCSAGYASPEHYGIDFSSDSETVNTEGATDVLGGGENDETEAVSVDRTLTEEEAAVSVKSESSSSARKRIVVPDVRSDIYSTGATLYHLMSGVRPARNATEVVPLSKKEFSPLVVKIITKAMNPNPDLRYQTAEEMLDDLLKIRERDPRVRRLKAVRLAGVGVLSLFLAGGAAAAFIGLKQMETTESWLKLSEYSGNALESGDRKQAVAYALEALPAETGPFTPPYLPEVQKALTDALGVYDLADGFQTFRYARLPSAPLFLKLSPEGKTAACVYSGGTAIIDTETADILKTLETESSALSEVRYVNEEEILYAGSQGISAYSLKDEKTVWTGEMATAIAVSADGTRAAAVYRDEPSAAVYDTADGTKIAGIDFEEQSQSAAVNDSFANPNDNLLSLNADGTLLGVSFSDGSLKVYDLAGEGRDLELFEADSGFTHFEGGFFGKYFAFSGTGDGSSVFAVIDMEELVQTGGFESKSAFHVQADETGIYVQTENLLVQIDPVTGDQTPLVTTPENILSFAGSDSHTVIATEQELQFFDRNASLTESFRKEYGSELLGIAGRMAVVGSRDTPLVQILRYESHPEAEVFSYDPSIPHDEARISADKKTVMLFRYDKFYLFLADGTLISETEIPDAEEVFDQQFVRDGEASRLDVYYNDGNVISYDAADGALLAETMGEKPDSTLFEEFYTDRLRIESPLHGTPAAYDKESGRLIKELAQDAYLTYVTQAGDYVVTQYVTADGEYYGQLLNENCEVLAELPYLSDVMGETLLFDYPTGNLRESRIYNLNELIQTAQNKTGGE